MANSKQSTAASRRERQRLQRDHQSRQQNRSRGKASSRPGVSPLSIIVGVLVAVTVIIVAFVVWDRSKPKADSTVSVLPAISSVNPTVYDTVGTGDVKNPLLPVPNQPILKGATGKPQFFYAGADYCPYCATERWAVVAALSRFGKFSHLDQITSSEGTISTFSFYKSSYSSNYIDFVGLETQGNADASGQTPTLQTPTTEQAQLLTKFNAEPYVSKEAAGHIPFIDIANQHLLSGASYDANKLMGLSWTNISDKMNNPSDDVTKGVIGTANYITAAICQTTANQPATVCGSKTINQIQQSIKKTSLNAHAPQQEAFTVSDALDQRRARRS